MAAKSPKCLMLEGRRTSATRIGELVQCNRLLRLLERTIHEIDFVAPLIWKPFGVCNRDKTSILIHFARGIAFGTEVVIERGCF